MAISSGMQLEELLKLLRDLYNYWGHTEIPLCMKQTRIYRVNLMQT
jgi:hypothetical protein